MTKGKAKRIIQQIVWSRLMCIRLDQEIEDSKFSDREKDLLLEELQAMADRQNVNGKIYEHMDDVYRDVVAGELT